VSKEINWEVDHGFKESLERGIKRVIKMNKDVNKMFESGRREVSDDLKRCPFCGQRAVIKRHVPKVGYVVQCEFCLAESWGPTQEDAVLSWQRRVLSPAVKALVEAAEQERKIVFGEILQGLQSEGDSVTIRALIATVKHLLEHSKPSKGLRAALVAVEKEGM
jgi:hypothetical protein